MGGTTYKLLMCNYPRFPRYVWPARDVLVADFEPRHQMADGLTKALSKQLHNRFIQQMGFEDISHIITQLRDQELQEKQDMECKEALS